MSELFTESPVVVTDRTTLGRWADCPFEAWQHGHTHVRDLSIPAIVGTECHQIISDVIKAHTVTPFRTGEFADMLRQFATASRTDLQPQIVKIMNSGAWPIAETITQQANGDPRHPDELLRFDGGEGVRSGQLAWDMPHDGVIYRLTGELDLLSATASPVELAIDDWKSGYRWWTGEEVRDSFQLGCFYPALVFKNYPTCEAVRVRVVMPAYGSATSPITIRQKDVYAINARLQTALTTYAKYRTQRTPEGIPCHPSPERCEWCACKMACPMVKNTVSGLPESREELLRCLVATQAAADWMASILTKHVRETGEEVAVDDLRFGTGKPKKPVAAKCDFYQIGASK